MTSTESARLTIGPTGDRWFLAVSGVDDLHESVPPPKAFLFVTKKEPKKSHRFRGGGRATRVFDPGPLLTPAADGGQKQ